MSVIELSAVLSTLFAGCSVLAAVYIFHRNTEREYFRGFRGSLVKYRPLYSTFIPMCNRGLYGIT